jgi:hypothetical protein
MLLLVPPLMEAIGLRMEAEDAFDCLLSVLSVRLKALEEPSACRGLERE